MVHDTEKSDEKLQLISELINNRWNVLKIVYFFKITKYWKIKCKY